LFVHLLARALLSTPIFDVAIMQVHRKSCCPSLDIQISRGLKVAKAA